MIAKKLLGCSLAAVLAWDVNATVVTYETTSLGAGAWQYDYSVTNNTLLSPIEEITIYFPLGLYSDLLSGSQPLNWDNIVVQPDPSLPADGFLDSLTLSAAILPGQTLAPFSIEFTWLGSGAPGSQFFEVVHPASFTVLDSGTTTAFLPPPSVPEPGTIPLAILGVAVLLHLSRHRGLSNPSLAAMRKLP